MEKSGGMRKRKKIREIFNLLMLLPRSFRDILIIQVLASFGEFWLKLMARVLPKLPKRFFLIKKLRNLKSVF